MGRQALVVGAMCALAVGCGGGTPSRSAAPKASAKKAAPAPTAGVGQPSLAFGGSRSAAERSYVRAVEAMCRKVGPIKPPSASTPLDARKAEMAREIRGLDRLSSELNRLAPPTLRLQRLVGAYVDRVEAQALLDRRIGDAAAAGDGQSVAVGMSENAHNRKARNDIVRELGLSPCLRARAPT